MYVRVHDETSVGVDNNSYEVDWLLDSLSPVVSEVFVDTLHICCSPHRERVRKAIS